MCQFSKIAKKLKSLHPIVDAGSPSIRMRKSKGYMTNPTNCCCEIYQSNTNQPSLNSINIFLLRPYFSFSLVIEVTTIIIRCQQLAAVTMSLCK